MGDGSFGGEKGGFWAGTGGNEFRAEVFGGEKEVFGEVGAGIGAGESSFFLERWSLELCVIVCY